MDGDIVLQQRAINILCILDVEQSERHLRGSEMTRVVKEGFHFDNWRGWEESKGRQYRCNETLRCRHEGT